MLLASKYDSGERPPCCLACQTKAQVAWADRRLKMNRWGGVVSVSQKQPLPGLALALGRR